MSYEYCPQCNLEMAKIYDRAEIPFASLLEKIPKYKVDEIKSYVDTHANGRQFFICHACGFIEEI